VNRRTIKQTESKSNELSDLITKKIEEFKMLTISTKIISFLVAIALALIIAPNMYENVPVGKYHITQSPFTGTLRSRINPGPYM
jgi:hypothetical protein